MNIREYHQQMKTIFNQMDMCVSKENALTPREKTKMWMQGFANWLHEEIARSNIQDLDEITKIIYRIEMIKK